MDCDRLQAKTVAKRITALTQCAGTEKTMPLASKTAFGWFIAATCGISVVQAVGKPTSALIRYSTLHPGYMHGGPFEQMAGQRPY